MYSHDAEVAVKCMQKRGCLAQTAALPVVCELSASVAAADAAAVAAGLALRGRLHRAQRQAGAEGPALFVPERPAADRALALYAAHVDAGSQRCVLGAVLTRRRRASHAGR